MNAPSRRSLLAAGLSLPALARAQDQRPLRLIVASAAGANADVVARMVAAEAEPGMGRRIIIENLPAASGMRAVEAVARAQPDGDTLLFGTISQLVMNIAIFDPLPVDVARALRGLSMINLVPMALVVPPHATATDLQGFIAQQRAGGRAEYGSGPVGTTTHVVGARFATEAGIARPDLVHVPYNSSALALTDVMAGRLTFMFDALLTALPHHRDRRARILGVAAQRRLPAAPDIPTLDEAGLPGFTGYTWNSIAAPAGMPEAIVQRLAEGFNMTLRRPALRDRLAMMGSELPDEPWTTAEVDAFYAAERQRWIPVVRATGLRPG